MIRFFLNRYAQFQAPVVVRFMMVCMANVGRVDANEKLREKNSYESLAGRFGRWLNLAPSMKILKIIVLERFDRLLSTSGSPPS